MLLSRRHFLAGLTGLALPAALSGCQVAPGTGREGFNLLSLDDERAMGRDAHPQILREFGGAYDAPELQAYVAGLGARLVRGTEAPGWDFRFTVLGSEIVNAMALPGGYVYVTRGLLALAGNEAELAGVLGHEIGHVTARHSAQSQSRAMAANLGLTILGAVVGTPGLADVANLGASAWLAAYSQDNEMEADSLGLRYLTRGGWDADAMGTMLSRLRDQSLLEARMAGRPADSVDEYHFMATHPRTLDRVRAAIAAAGGGGKGLTNADAFLDRIDGLVWGSDPAEGVIRGRRFLHPALGLSFEAPPGFRLGNGPRTVTARDGSGAVIVFDGAPARGYADMLDYIQRLWVPRARLANPERFTVDGLDGATVTTQGSSRQGDMDVRLVAIRFDGGTVYRFTFLSPPGRTNALARAFRDTGMSFRRLTAGERTAIRPLTIKVVAAGRGDTAESLGERMALADWKTEQFRLLNGLPEGGQPHPGQRVKLVV